MSVSVCVRVCLGRGKYVKGVMKKESYRFVLVFTLFNNRRIGDGTITFYWPLLYMKEVMKKERRYIPQEMPILM